MTLSRRLCRLLDLLKSTLAHQPALSIELVVEINDAFADIEVCTPNIIGRYSAITDVNFKEPDADLIPGEMWTQLEALKTYLEANTHPLMYEQAQRKKLTASVLSASHNSV